MGSPHEELSLEQIQSLVFFFFLKYPSHRGEKQENKRIPVLFSVKEEITTAPGLHTLLDHFFFFP